MLHRSQYHLLKKNMELFRCMCISKYSLHWKILQDMREHNLYWFHLANALIPFWNIQDLYQHADFENMQNIESIENNSSKYIVLIFFIYLKWCFATVYFNVDSSCISIVFNGKICVRDTKFLFTKKTLLCYQHERTSNHQT